MVKVREIYAYLDGRAPFSIQMDFDNAGLLIGAMDACVDRVLVALDATMDVVREAAEKRCRLLVTHHPLIFHPLKAVCPSDPTQAVVAELIRNDIALISAHTNLDQVHDGVSRALMDRLGVKTHGILEERGLTGGQDTAEGSGLYGLGCWGELSEPMEPKAFAEHVKKALDARSVRAVLGDRPVRKVAVCGGAGGDMVELAAGAGMDAFVTAEVKHHEFLAAKALDITLLDAGHYATENPMMPVLARELQQAFDRQGVEVLLSAVHREPYESI